MLAQKQDHEIFTIIIKNIEKILNSKSYVDSQSFVSEKYHDLINVFEKKKQISSYLIKKNTILKLI